MGIANLIKKKKKVEKIKIPLDENNMIYIILFGGFHL